MQENQAIQSHSKSLETERSSSLNPSTRANQVILNESRTNLIVSIITMTILRKKNKVHVAKLSNLTEIARKCKKTKRFKVDANGRRLTLE